MSRSRLCLQPLEDRATPATAVYTALTQTLTVTAVEADKLLIASIPDKPTGYFAVTETVGNATVFSSDIANKVIRNFVFKFGNVNIGEVKLAAGTAVGGNLIISGAKDTQFVDILGTVSGNFTYTPNTLAAFEDIDFEASAIVGGNVAIGLGGGENTLRLKGGRIYGNLSVLGGATGIDLVEVMDGGNMTIDGYVSMNLAGGKNDVVSKNIAPVMNVAGSFNYIGGNGNDTFNLDATGATLNVKGDVKFTLGNALMFDANLVKLESLTAGKSITFNGAIGDDRVMVSGAIVAGTNLTLALGNGINEFESNEGGMATNSVGGNLTYTGGASGDVVSLDSTTIGKNLTVTLGENGGAGQVLFAGLNTPAGITVHGNVKVTGGSGAEGVLFRRMSVGGSLAVTTGGGDDVVTFDNTHVAGLTMIDLGAGSDLLQSELLTGDGGGTLSGGTTFGGAVTIKAGDGADIVDLSADANNQTFIRFGSRLVVLGGNQGDTLRTSADNSFEVSGNFTDMEVVVGPALP